MVEVKIEQSDSKSIYQLVKSQVCRHTGCLELFTNLKHKVRHEMRSCEFKPQKTKAKATTVKEESNVEAQKKRKKTAETTETKVNEPKVKKQKKPQKATATKVKKEKKPRKRVSKIALPVPGLSTTQPYQSKVLQLACCFADRGCTHITYYYEKRGNSMVEDTGEARRVRHQKLFCKYRFSAGKVKEDPVVID